MEKGFATPEARRAAAHVAVEALVQPDRSVKLRVQCAESHHVATVYDTDVGLVYVARSGPHSHGSRDFVDVAHHDAVPGVEVVDVLDPGTGAMADDALPATCECGPRRVSRSELLRAVESGQHRLLVS